MCKYVQEYVYWNTTLYMFRFFIEYGVNIYITTIYTFSSVVHDTEKHTSCVPTSCIPLSTANSKWVADTTPFKKLLSAQNRFMLSIEHPLWTPVAVRNVEISLYVFPCIFISWITSRKGSSVGEFILLASIFCRYLWFIGRPTWGTFRAWYVKSSVTWYSCM